MSVCDQMRIHHLIHLSLININHNTSKMKTERKGKWSRLSHEKIKLKRQSTMVIYEKSDELMTTDGKMI